MWGLGALSLAATLAPVSTGERNHGARALEARDRMSSAALLGSLEPGNQLRGPVTFGWEWWAGAAALRLVVSTAKFTTARRKV